jgi:Family of unknown function (DUF6932)
MIPDFDADGNLPPGVHWATWQEFVQRFGMSPHRDKLLMGLRSALDGLKAAGCQAVYIDGSFVTTKSVPNDFDACWDTEGVNPDLLDPILLLLTHGRVAQKAKYFGELFPAQFSEGMTGLRFLEFFQIDKETGKLKGIIAIDLRRL